MQIKNDNIDIKERIKDEYLKCATDPVYFMKKFYMIQHPQRGRQMFDLYPLSRESTKVISKAPRLYHQQI